MDKDGFMRTCGECNAVEISGEINHYHHCSKWDGVKGKSVKVSSAHAEPTPAPERIHLQWTGTPSTEENTWCEDQIHDDDVEYIKLAAVGLLISPLLQRCKVWIDNMSDELPGYAPLELLDELEEVISEA